MIFKDVSENEYFYSEGKLYLKLSASYAVYVGDYKYFPDTIMVER